YMIRQARTCVTEERAADYFPVQRGDVLFAASGEDLAEIGRSAVVLFNDRACCGGDLVVLRPELSVVPEFLGYACDCWVAKAQKASMGRGTTVKHIYPDELKRLLLAVPTQPEQAAIAAFLDRETAKIDALIAEQQRLIELLQEKRQAVISHAVTKGLNPDAPMKDSGIEWLGEVPEHWEVVRLRYLCDIQTGSRDTENAVDDGAYPFFVRSETVERINTCAANCEAVFTAGDGAGVGKVFHHYQGPFDFHQRVYMMNNFRQVTGRFLYHYLRANFYKVALEGTAKSTVDSLRRPMFTGFSVAVPPLKEQENLVATIESEASDFDSLVAEAECAIALLQERRSALISAAVTGQIDVRGLAGSEAA
ncbi:MAG: restriction endonuclease subunit S, partial [Planctomycetia bacterium]